MGYLEQILGTTRDSVSTKHLMDFFQTPQTESDIFEIKCFFSKNEKSYPDKEREVLKTISAFLNSKGRLLIWGGPIGILDNNTKICAPSRAP